MLRGARQNNPGAGEHGASAACLASSALAAPAPEGFSCASWLAWKTTERKPFARRQTKFRPREYAAPPHRLSLWSGIARTLVALGHSKGSKECANGVQSRARAPAYHYHGMPDHSWGPNVC